MVNRIFDEKPRKVSIDLSVGHIVLHAAPGAQNAAVTLEPMHGGDEEAEKAIQAATVELSGGNLVIRVQLPKVITNGGSYNQVTVGNQSYTSGTEITMVNGLVVGGASDAVRTDGVRVTVHLPEEVDVRIDTVSAGVGATGLLGLLRARSASGVIRVEDVIEADVENASGDVEITGSLGKGTVRNVYGDIEVARVLGAVHFDNVSGHVNAHTETDQIHVNTVSGGVRITHPAHVTLPERVVRTVTGRSRVSVKG